MRNTAGLCLAAVLCFEFTGCSKNSAPPPAAAQTESADPAQANLAPVSQQSDVSYPPRELLKPSAPQAPEASYPAPEASYPEDNDSSQPPVYAQQPPPPIPQYSQPECPGPNYLWTPGTWNYASAGYYWVPGVWVMAPFVGALWTPSYWASDGNRYRWHHGYWSSHVGFYGGVNYGFGYVGSGYEGGYWNRDHFAYNRTVNNVNISTVKNVYNYRVTNITNVRTSYVGGRGGLNVRPTGAELAVMHERRIAPLPEQVQHIRQAANNRLQFAEVNHGRPETPVAARPLETKYHAPAAHAAEVPGARALPPAAEPAARPPMHSEAAHTQPARPESHPDAAARTPVQPAKETHPAAREERPEVRPSAPQPHAEPRPEPERRPAPETRPAPAARPEAPRAEEKPRPEQAKPEPKREERRPPLA